MTGRGRAERRHENEKRKEVTEKVLFDGRCRNFDHCGRTRLK